MDADTLLSTIETLTQERRASGWCSVAKARKLAELVLKVKPLLTVEIGVFGGSSLVPLALAAQATSPDSRIVGIDPWEVDAALEAMLEPDNIKYWSKIPMDKVYRDCAALLSELGLASCCELMRSRSDAAVGSFRDECIDILHVDGNHSEQLSMADVRAYFPKVRPLGYIVFDDINWNEKGKSTTRKAMQYLLNRGCVEIDRVGDCVILKKADALPYLTICYITMRKEPKIEWFFDSLAREFEHAFPKMRCVVVDFWADTPGRKELFKDKAPPGMELVHVPPKPTIWQGPHRLTTRDYFAAANARNTGLCLAKDGWIAYADDLSLLMPGWLDSVREAMVSGYIVAGAYRKVWMMAVTNGHVMWSKEKPNGEGLDSRWSGGRDDRAVRMDGGGFFGCSIAGPVEAFLDINGWDEDCDAMGGEDSICGIVLNNAGYKIKYDRRMLTLEDDSLHHPKGEAPLLRIIKMKPSDASYAILDMRRGRTKIPGHWGEPGTGIREMREAVLAGNPFPIMEHPQHHWADGQPLAEM